MTRIAVPVLLAVTAAASAGPAFPGGVLDSTRRTAFVPAEDGLEAVDLDTGLTRWKSREANWPVLVDGQQLVALAVSRGSLTAVWLDLAAKGERSPRSVAVDVPSWADASSLRCAWELRRRSLEVSWQARGTLGRPASGAAAVDLDRGTVTKLEPAQTAVVVPKMLEKLAVRWHRSVAGSVHAVVEEPSATSTFMRRRSKLVLRVWNEATGKEGQPQELLEGARPMLLAGVDGMHVWVRDAGAYDGPADGAGSPWQVHSALDGQRVARVPFVPGTVQAVVIDGRAFGLATRSGRVLLEGKAARRHELYAVDLGSGKVAWRKPVRESGATPR